MTRETLIQRLKDEGVPEEIISTVVDSIEASGDLYKLDDDVGIVVKKTVKVEQLYPKESKHYVDKKGNLCVGGKDEDE